MALRKADVEWLPLRTLIPHPRIQRRLIAARVKHLSADFTPDGLGVFTVWLADGKAYIIDGQHRWRAGMDTGHGETKVKCHVYRNGTTEQMAELFLLLNDSRFVSPIDKFEVGLTAQNARCVAIATMLGKYDLRVGASSADGNVRCVDKLFALYDRDPDLLDRTIRVATETWGTRTEALETVILSALGKVLGHYNGQLDPKALVQRLTKYPGGPAGLIGNARALAGMKPIGVTRAAAEIIVDTYNRRARSGSLPPL